MKGVYTIEKYEGTLVDGEWVKGDLIEVIDDLENKTTPQLAIMLMVNDTQGKRTTQMVVGYSTAMFPGAEGLEATSAYAGEGTLLANATYTAAAGMDDAFYEITTTLNPPGAGTRYIRTVFLTSNYGGSSDDCYSIVALTTPCPQTDVQILQINYKITLDATTLLAEGTRSSYANEVFFAGSFSSVLPSFSNGSVFVGSFDRDIWGKGIKFQTVQDADLGTNEMFGSGSSAFPGTNQLTEHLSKQGVYQSTLAGQFGTSNVSTSSTDWCGYPVKGAGAGSSRGVYAWATVDKGTDSSIQNTFGRIADTGATRKMFLDTNTISTSAATVSLLDKGDWVDHINDSYMTPYLYRITMETGGIVGTATYKVQRRKFGRWDSNDATWPPLGIALPQMNCVYNGGVLQHMDDNDITNSRHGQIIYNTTNINSSTQPSRCNSNTVGWAGWLPQRYVFPEFITWDYTGITINSTNGEYTNIDTDTTPALNVTEVLQVASDGSDIYIADAATGLWKIERNIDDFVVGNFTITQLSPPGITDVTSCRGVTSKGGSAMGGPGKIVDVRIIKAGSEYAVSDTVTFVGANGTLAAAAVNAVDANGGITEIRITNKGSGYIEDHLQVYVSSTTGGTGASLEATIGSGGDVWALFDDVTDTVMYLAHTTRLTSDHTNLNFQTGGDTITRTGGASDFLAEGFLVGQKLIIKNAADAGNNGTFSITAVTATVITVSENLTTNATDTTAQIEGVNWEVMRSTITTTETLTYVANGTGVGDTITGTGTQFDTQGFVEGMKIVISSSLSNDGIYTIADVTGFVITLVTEDVLVAEGPLSDTMAALTDFTILNYTSGTPGRVGFIGLILDQEHADDRFMMLTPTNKKLNNGTELSGSGDAGFDWWSFANSTGTTTAGTTDRVRVGADADGASMATERFATLAAGPLSTGPNHWTVQGIAYNSSGYATWGSSTLPLNRGFGPTRFYTPLRNSTFNVTLPCRGNSNSQNLCTKDVVADMSAGTAFDTRLLYDYGDSNSLVLGPGTPWNLGFHWGYVGRGIFLALNHDVSVNEPNAASFFTCNGNGTLADEAALPYGFWQEYGWNGNDWVLDNASAKTTHPEVSFSGSGIDITAATGVIVGAGFTNWATDGFLVGDIITIATSEDPANDGLYTIEQLSGTSLTVTPDKLPAFDTTIPNDTTATVVGSHALIDGLAVSFDDNVGADALVVDESYDTHVFDGILKDNATNFSVPLRFTWKAEDSGTDFSDAGSATFTMPSADRGPVTGEKLAGLYYNAGSGATSLGHYIELGIAGSKNNISTGIAFNHEIPASTDFELRFKAAGCYAGHEIHMGVVPWSTITDGSNNIATTELDENIKIEFDAVTYPEQEQYTVRAKLTGNGADQLVYSADRVQIDTTQTQVDYDGVTGGYGDFIDGTGYANNDVITMDDGSTVTVQQSGTQVTTFVITTGSLRTSGRTERIIESVNWIFKSCVFR